MSGRIYGAFIKCLIVQLNKNVYQKALQFTLKTVVCGDLFCDFRFGPPVCFCIILKFAFESILMLTHVMFYQMIYLSIKPSFIKIGVQLYVLLTDIRPMRF